ncbi:Mitochondrial intermediate peptidase [Papilio machaon]|uniref:Mitochondrial intermediate peptidase n=1 Tax=Papilio machaon TaxID=76193 RepID=A0A0N1IQ00_PAPMA|nr:Mitochondrial intermediate peptidase [Papilio machaon]
MLSLSGGHRCGPALLSAGAVDNLFHEAGHALHSMLGRAPHQHVAGTRCATDLAELPSVLLEHFASEPQVVRRFARHFQTREPMPEDMLQRLCASKHLFGASEMQLQVFYSALDQKYHGPEAALGRSTTDVLEQVQKQYYGLPYVENTAWQHRFSHLIGYGAKYYSYLISRAAAWGAWSSQFASQPLNRRAGDAFRHGVLRHGGAKPPQLVVEFRDEKVVRQSLAHLHDAYNGCINLVLPVLEHALLCRLLFLTLQTIQIYEGTSFLMKIEEMSFRGLLHLYLVDLDAEEFVGEFIVEGEVICVVNFATSRRLAQYTSFAARQRLQSTSQFTFL